jgi:hypothetical protein
LQPSSFCKKNNEEARSSVNSSCEVTVTQDGKLEGIGSRPSSSERRPEAGTFDL